VDPIPGRSAIDRIDLDGLGHIRVILAVEQRWLVATDLRKYQRDQGI
jgi:hypothetical protein